MKTLKFLALMLILLGIAVSTLRAQAIVMTEDDNDGRIPTLWSQYEDGSWHSYTSPDWHLVITPSGNLNGIFNFDLNLQDVLVPENGSNTVTMEYRMKDAAGIVHKTIAYVIIIADGSTKVIAHFNPEEE